MILAKLFGKLANRRISHLCRSNVVCIHTARTVTQFLQLVCVYIFVSENTLGGWRVNILKKKEEIERLLERGKRPPQPSRESPGKREVSGSIPGWVTVVIFFFL